MDSAYDNSKPGNRDPVQAKDISDDPYEGQYSCPRCGEPVRFYRGEIQKAHFRHKEGSIIAQTCEFYAENCSASSEDELKRKISGLPFYLKQIGDSFKLYLGFWPVGESDLAKEKQRGQKVTIENNKKSLMIDLGKIRANEVYHLPLSCVYESYRLIYQVPKTALKEIWGENTSRIFSNGIFFRIGDSYSCSISLNGVITLDTSYYFLSQYPVTNTPFLKVEESHPLLMEGTPKWRIYKIHFTQITLESAQYARDHHVYLLEKPPELVPLWPPSIQNNRKQIHHKTGICTYCLNSSHESGIWEIFILDKDQIPSDKREVSLQDPIFSINVDKNIQYLSFFDTDSDLEVALVSRDDKTDTSYQQPELGLKWMKKEIRPGSELKAIKNADLSIKSNMKCDVIRMRDQIPNLIFRDETSVLSFPDVSDGDTIIIRHGLDILGIIYFRNTKKTADDKHNSNLRDEALYLRLLHLRGTAIPVSAQLKYIAARLVTFPKTSEYLKKALKSGKIPNRAPEYLIKMYKQGGL